MLFRGKIKCTSCGIEFIFGDKMSPVFKDEIWKEILKFYKLEKWEKKSKRKFTSLIRKAIKDKDQNLKDELRSNPEYHTFICYECAEKALGRKIKLEDLRDCPANKPFKQFYFNEQISY